ncbi:RNA polymerase factor sigma-54 [Ramlibacter sp. MAHUQ-53]|uniref:RNA polymerase factor sigma-54 n=1 Tax=unclassified Ramlibacter TaxID=2617605 RepID=UPI0036436BDC
MNPSLALHAAPALATTLSPRLQRAVRLLQMSSQDYAQVLRQQLDTNPFLEPLDGFGPGEAFEPLDDPRDDGPPEDGWGAEPLPQARGEPGGGLLETLQAPATLAEHLCGQLRLLPLPPRDRALALALAHAVDDDGYLRMALPEAAAPLALRPPPDDSELAIALRRVQALDPAGVGARGVAECLLLQLAPAPLPAPLRALAMAIVAGHLGALAGRDIATLARRLRAPRAQVEAAVQAIRRLDPRPGWRQGGAQASHVTPDVVVRRRQGQWVASLNPAVVPRVRVNDRYADLFARHRAACGGELGAQLQEARWTVRNVDQRFATILAVARAIVQRQHRFLAYGPMAMKPLALREIAQAVGVHESTVSRVSHQKFMATPGGLFELKYFFSRGLATAGGGACSPTAIRGLIRELVAAEPREAPLSDVALAQALERQGLQVARRTVTKYRQQMRIEPADRRYSSIR